MKTEAADKNSTHLAGEYFVAAELYRRGYSLGMTIGNAKAIDIFVDKDGRTIAVQVKAIRDKKSAGWPMTRSRVKNGIMYVFVLLNEPARRPDYFIATAREVRPRVKQYKTRGVLDISKMKSKQFRERWDKI